MVKQGIEDIACAFTTGTPHLQGYIHFNRKEVFSTVRDLLPNRCHIQQADGSPSQNRTYCSKEGDFEEYGETPPAERERTDYDAVVEWVRNFIVTHDRAPSYYDIAQEKPQYLLRHRDLVNVAAAMEPRRPLMHDIDGVMMRDWQAELYNELKNDCTDDRKIKFYVDENGSTGKSWFCRFVVSKWPDRVDLLTPEGTYRDLAYLLDPNHDIVLINVARNQMDQFATMFAILEHMKDKFVLSTK